MENEQLSWKCFEPRILTLERCKNSLKFSSKSFKLIFDVITKMQILTENKK